jgi:phospholipid-translocating ATPase
VSTTSNDTFETETLTTKNTSRRVVTRKLTETGLVDCTSASVKVGDIIEVHANQRIPADLVLLYTNDVSGTVFIRTDQLDGETDWKLRKPIATTQALVAAKKNLRVVPGAVQCNPPSKLIYEFIGVYEGDDGKKEPLDLENTMWANTVLCSGKILGLIIFTGKETRMAMNSKDAREKRGSLDLELNVLSKVLFIFMTILSILIVLASGTHENLLFFTIKFILLTSSIIPISLRVNLDFSKIVFSYKISNDPRMPGALARNSEIPEELGRIQFILSDKTGTLTQNEMIFKNLSLEQNQFKDEDIDELRKILKSECTKEKGPMPDVFRRMQETRDKGKTVKRVSDKVVRDMLTAIAVCHNVTPVDEDGVKTYQASSPDEVALVKLAESVGLSLEFRDQKTMKLKNAIGAEENYEILENFPFSSETKRMGIVVRHKETNRLIFYLKGADVALVNKVPEIQKGFLQDECENLAREGLRTLVITQRALTESEYQDWKKVYYAAQISSNRAENTKAAIEQLEKGMDFLGITGVEDKLQEDVRVSIESIRNAGIQFWMLTGDKIETACCIAISTSLKTPQQDFFIMRDMTDTQTMERKLNEFGNNINNQRDQVLVIDGQSIHTVTEYNESMFFSLACRVTSVICCRCSPTQKAYITEKIKHYTGKKTLGIGDGGNDVGMILSADVGVGIVGKEGKQAALASDFSIYKFKHVTNLLLWHGRNSYKRGAVMAQFVIHRGLIISIMQMYFSIMFYYVAIPLFNGFLMLGYGTVFTMLPVFSLVGSFLTRFSTRMSTTTLR